MNAKVTKKIKTPDALREIIDKHKKNGKQVVLCHGVFDIIHLGHIRHFNMAKKEGDVLVVSTTKDRFVKRGPGRPVFNENLRLETLASLEIIDYVSVVDSPTAIEFIKKIRPSVYAKGMEYKAKDKDVTGRIYDEEDAITSVGGRLAFTDDITFSSSSILNGFLDTFPSRTVKYLKVINKRYSIDSIVDSIHSLKKLKALVIGDTIIDQYHYCDPMGKSSKADIVVNRYNSKETFAGGVLATANNVASVCGGVDLMTVLGEDDSYQKFIESKLSSNIKPVFFFQKGKGITIKRRYIGHGSKQKLFEICFMDDTDIVKREENKIIKWLEKTIEQYDVVIVSDFGHGLLTRRIIDLLVKKSRYLAINAQTNGANAGFNLVTKYPSADCVCIDEMELRYAAHDKFGDVRTLSKNIYSEIGCDHIIATRGNIGSLCYSGEHGYHETPSFANSVVDAIGAGDAFFAFIAPCFAAGMSPDLVSFIGNAAGSLAVQIVCNREPVHSVDLIKFITRLLK